MSSNEVKGWQLVPTELTAENGMKAALMGEFHVRFPVFDEFGNECIHKVNVPWTVIKQIHRAIVAAVPRPPVPVLKLETRLSDRDVKALADYLARGSAPPASRDELVGCSDGFGTQVAEYRTSADRELRKAAEALTEYCCGPMKPEIGRMIALTDNLRAALERQL
jgi:hypothetical protein